MDLAVLGFAHVEEAGHEGGPLEDERRDEEVDPNRSKPVPLQEGHEEPETNKDHHVDILEHWNEN